MVLRLTAKQRPPQDVLEAAALAVKEKLAISFNDLEIHKRAGGDPLKVVTTIIEYKRKGKTLDFKLATVFDLAGEEFQKMWGDDVERPH